MSCKNEWFERREGGQEQSRSYIHSFFYEQELTVFEIGSRSAITFRGDWILGSGEGGRGML